VTEVGTFASQVGEFGFNQAGQLEHTQAVVDKYISEELVQDMPTGEPDLASLGTFRAHEMHSQLEVTEMLECKVNLTV